MHNENPTGTGRYKSAGNEPLAEHENGRAHGLPLTGIASEMPVMERQRTDIRKTENLLLKEYKPITSIFPGKKIIIGKDDRVPVTETEYPFNIICLLLIKDKFNRKYFGTGFFISERCIATAGHCVFFDKNWVQEIKVVPGAFGSNEPYGSDVSNRFRSVEGWTVNKDGNFDHGALILKDNSLFNKVKACFGYKAMHDEAALEISGYPIDKAMTQWKCEGEVSNLTAYRIYYELDTMKGNSGSPVYVKIDDHRIVVGVHSYGQNPNYAIRIKQEIIDRWSEWSKL